MLYFKIGIAAELRRHFPSETGKPRSKITESLGTDSWIQARALRDQRVAHWGRVFARLAAGAALSPEEIAGEQHRIRQSTLAMLREPDDENRATFLRHALPIALRQQIESPGFATRIAAEVRRIANEKYGEGFITEGSPEWNAIQKVVDDVMLDALKGWALGMLGGAPPVEPSNATHVSHLPPTNGNERFSVAAEKCLAWLGNERGNRKATVAEYKAKIDRFVKFANDPLLGAVTIDMAKAFLADVAKETSPQTINMYHHAVRSVFEHARNERHLFSEQWVNPFSFKRRKVVQQSKARFTVEELNALFGSPAFVGRQIKPKKYDSASAVPWAAAIALYSGATLEEIAQLRPCDIRKEKGDGWVIDITPDAAISHRLKREARRRIVPLHPQLESLGLLRYLDGLPRDAKRVFPGLPIGGKGKDRLGSALGKAFKRWRDKVGIASTEERKIDFHSFRHCFGKAIEDAGVPASDRARLLGHAVPGISSSVYSAPDLRRVTPYVAKVNFK
jgi:integrase